ncbi:SDR family oxidoreductase [Corynebacterium sp. NPDC060344]|uniref:SDR family oxidoreductase n=1 Tax=Corynebacterium sp. NPDC060344 TaxID=3347101 RepID=UPI0036675CBA
MNEARTGGRKFALVTGGGAGIGAEVATALAADGWTVRICGRTSEALERTCAADPERLSWARCDVTDEAGVDALFAGIAEDFGRIDLVVVNAGVPGPTAPLGEIDAEGFRGTVEINLTGAFLTARAAFRAMAAQDPAGGRILFNGSIAAQTPRPHSAPYAASKAGLAGLAAVTGLDGRAHGITATRIDIGNAATGLLAGFGAATGALQADGSRVEEPTFPAAEAARAFVYAASLPPSAVVDQLTVTAAGMPFAGRG